MKMVIAVVNSDDSNAVMRALTKNGYYATKLATTGGFLMMGNTTFLIGIDEDKVDDVISLISSHSKKRKQVMPAATSYGVGMYDPLPIEVTVGGASIFVMDIERFEKV
ncbi:MAG: cyclic-di-AMP receptor [Oscillospiraceae bacterium]|nr:cyclic-di-AMP receptor [Oscillospiraceae bacterium]